MRYEKTTDPFYKSKPWRNVRRMALERDLYFCVECMEAYRRGEIRKPKYAVMVHHIKPRDKYPELELDLNNLQSLCDAHHNKKHPEKGRKEPENPCGEDSVLNGVRVIKV